jgi:lysozyme
MMASQPINQSGLELIKHFESLRLDAYQDSVGVWTIGWGHTGLVKNDMSVYQGQSITEQEAEDFLKQDLVIFEDAVTDNVNVDINSNQYSALVSFCFNLGATNLRKSTLLRKLNETNYFAAAKEFKKWSKAGGRRMEGLVRRRISERNLYCSFVAPVVAALPTNWEKNYKEL